MPSQKSAGEPGRIEVQVDDKVFAPGDTINFSVVVTAGDRLSARALVAELLGVEEVDPYGDEDDEFEGEDEELEADNVLTLSVNGGTEEDEEDEDEDFEDEDGDELISNITYDDEITLAKNLALNAGESRTFNGSFTLPEDALPTYEGIQALHTWWIEVYLDNEVEISESKELTVR